MKEEEFLKYYKKTDYNGLFIKRWYRYFAVRVSALISKTSITPNQITIFRGILIFPATILFMFGNYLYSLLAAFLVILAHFLDWVDGVVARMKKQETNLGMWLSHFDTLMIPLFFFGIAFGQFRRTGNPYMLALGFLAFTAYKWLDDLLRGFRSMFSFSGEVIGKFNKKRRILKNFFFGDYLILNTMFIFAVFNILDIYLYVMAVYGWLSVAAGFTVFYSKIARYEKIHRKS